jgi:hypothetical protein
MLGPDPGWSSPGWLTGTGNPSPPPVPRTARVGTGPSAQRRDRGKDKCDMGGSHGGQAVGRGLDAPGMSTAELYRRLAG